MARRGSITLHKALRERAFSSFDHQWSAGALEGRGDPQARTANWPSKWYQGLVSLMVAYFSLALDSFVENKKAVLLQGG